MPQDIEFYQFGSGWFISRHVSGTNKLPELELPSTGIYYVLRLPQGWRLAVCRYQDASHELDHTEFWESQCCKLVIRIWSRELKRPVRSLTRELLQHPYGFPRGRVIKRGNRYMVLHGSDLDPSFRVNVGTIEAIFGIKDEARWVEDDDEHCLLADKESVRMLLRLEEDWAAV